MKSYCEMAKALDDWSGYHDRFNRNIRAVCEMLADGWGRMPDEHTARAAMNKIREFHGGKPENCPRASRLLACLS